MKHRLMTATAIAVSLPLGGCAGLFDFGAPKSASVAQERETLDMTAYFERRVADGQRHLAAGRLSKAEVAFRQASRNASTAAPAFNGLAITYDRLGRTDLAERYFKSAVAFAEPDDFRYARNLARFEGKQLRRKLEKEEAQRVLLAKRAEPAPVAQVAAVAAPVETAQKSPFEVAFADLAQDAPLAKRAASHRESKRAETAVPTPDVKPEPAPVKRPVVTAARTEAPSPAVRVAAAPAPRIRTTGRLIAPAQSAAPIRSAGIRVENRPIGLVRVSKNEVRIGRSAHTAQVDITAPSAAPAKAMPSDPVEQASGADQAELPITDLSDASSISSSGSAERTPLALVDAWTSFQAGS